MLGINAGAIATIMLISRVFDGVLDIFMGYVVDRTHSPKGKARVWVLRGAIPYILSVIGLFFVPSGASDIVKYVYIFVMCKHSFMKLAADAGAVYKINKISLVNVKVFEEYLETFRVEN